MITPRVIELLKQRQGSYNHLAAQLEAADATQRENRVVQIAVPDDARLIGRLETDADRVAAAVRLGARAMASALVTGSIDLYWQPVVCRTGAVARESIEAPPPRGTSERRRLRPSPAANRTWRRVPTSPHAG